MTKSCIFRLHDVPSHAVQCIFVYPVYTQYVYARMYIYICI